MRADAVRACRGVLSWRQLSPAADMAPHQVCAAAGPGCVKTLRGITAPEILRLAVTLRAKKRKNSSSARRYDQIRFRFHTAWTHSGRANALRKNLQIFHRSRCGEC